MIAATIVVEIDVSRDWLGFPVCRGSDWRTSQKATRKLISTIRQMPAPVHVGFEGDEDQGSIQWIDPPMRGGQERALVDCAC